MLLTKLSKKYHLLNREQKLRQIRETSREESESENSTRSNTIVERVDESVEHFIINSSKPPTRNVERNEYRPSPEVIVISSTSSETSSEKSCNNENVEKRNVGQRNVKESEKSTILMGMGNERRTIDSTFDPSCKRTSCAGWKRLESTHVDHLDEVGRRNISLWTDDVSAINDVLTNNDVLSEDNDDRSTSFETAFTHFVQTPKKVDKKVEKRLEVLAENSSSTSEVETSVPNFRRQSTNFGKNKKRLSVLGRNEVILLTSDSDTSSDDDDDGEDKENVANLRSNKHELNKSKLDQVLHLFKQLFLDVKVKNNY
jgi:hypothetical protein